MFADFDDPASLNTFATSRKRKTSIEKDYKIHKWVEFRQNIKNIFRFVMILPAQRIFATFQKKNENPLIPEKK